MARFVYIDETGSLGATVQNQPALQLVAVIVDEDAVQPLAKAQEVAFKHLGWYPADFEFHGNELWRGRGYWDGKTPPQLLAAFEEALSLLTPLDLWLAHSSTNRPKLHVKYGGQADANAYRLALQFLLEKVDGLRGNKIVIADESKEQELRAVKMLGSLQEWGSGEVPGRTLTSIIDSLHFVQSHASPGVQMANLCAYLMHRCRLTATESHPDAHAARERMMQEIGSRIVTYRMRWPA